MKANIEAREGYSGVDHLLPMVITFANERMQGIDYETATGAKIGAWAAIRWVLKRKYVNGEKTYGRMGITMASFTIGVNH